MPSLIWMDWQVSKGSLLTLDHQNQSDIAPVAVRFPDHISGLAPVTANPPVNALHVNAPRRFFTHLLLICD